MTQRATPDRLTVKELLARLVSFDTTSHKSNLALVAFVRDYLDRNGVESQLIYSDDKQKANLHALIGPKQDGGIGLSGHTDCVPVTGQAWDSDPFALVERDGRLYGRGSTDMKGFLACVLASVPEFKRCALARPVQILFSYDEEVGCTGVRPMIAKMGSDFPRPMAVIVGEPTNMHVVDAHKGPVLWDIEITGRAGHSSMPHLGVNAISWAGRILAELEEIAVELERTSRDARFDPPHSTLQVTTIDGGTASNIIPAGCRIGFGIRGLPRLDIAVIENRLQAFFREVCLPEMMKVAPEAEIVLREINRVPPFSALASSAAVSLALKARSQNETLAVSYATEAGLFQDGRAPAVVCGPGSIAQAHTANEWVATDELDTCMEFLARLADQAEV